MSYISENLISEISYNSIKNNVVNSAKLLKNSISGNDKESARKELKMAYDNAKDKIKSKAEELKPAVKTTAKVGAATTAVGLAANIGARAGAGSSRENNR